MEKNTTNQCQPNYIMLITSARILQHWASDTMFTHFLLLGDFLFHKAYIAFAVVYIGQLQGTNIIFCSSFLLISYSSSQRLIVPVGPIIISIRVDRIVFLLTCPPVPDSISSECCFHICTLATIVHPPPAVVMTQYSRSDTQPHWW